MKRKLCICLMAAASSFAALGGQPIASVSGSSSFELDGNLVNTAGVTGWPLMAGDRIAARDSAVVIAMKDGSRITLAANSQMRFESASVEPTANLVSGAMQFSIAPGSSLRVLKGQVPVLGRSGTISAGSADSSRSAAQFVKAPKPPAPISVR